MDAQVFWNVIGRYNPDNPNENCTVYEKRWQTGNGEALATIVIIGVSIIVPILLKLLVN